MAKPAALPDPTGAHQLRLGNRVRVARHTRGYSQARLAELVGVSRNTISAIETGVFSPTAKLALILCVALDAAFEDLFYLEHESAE